jgi:hypothetical protein
MTNRMFILLIIVLLFFNGFFFFQTKTEAIMITFPMSLDIYSPREGLTINGTGNIDSNSLILTDRTWPNIGQDQSNFRFQQESPKTRSTPVVFEIEVNLNNIQHKLSIDQFSKPGWYKGTVTFYFESIQRGNYNLTVRLMVDGQLDNSCNLDHHLIIP